MRIDLVYFDAGGGHRSAALALEQVIRDQKRPWNCRLVNLQHLLDPMDPFRKLTGVRLQDFYNLMLKRGWTAGSAEALRLLHFMIRKCHAEQVELIRRHWSESPPEMVVSVLPHFNAALLDGLEGAAPGVPLVTILTDLADYPPDFWIQSPRQHVICGTGTAVAQALAQGCPSDRIRRVSGMILHPRFYEPAPFDREAERVRLGLDPSLPAVLVLFGGAGSTAMLPIARRLSRLQRRVQLILLCGTNTRLARRLRNTDFGVPTVVEGYTTEVPRFMRLADLFVGKPGPGSISEALVMGLPVIVERSARTLVQERYNTEWVLKHEVGLALRGFRRIGPAVEFLLEPKNYCRYRAAVAAFRNRAVFEIPDILADIAERRAGAPLGQTVVDGNVSSDVYSRGIRA